LALENASRAWRKSSGRELAAAGLDLDVAVAACVRTSFLIDQPVWSLIQRLSASAVKTMVGWASMESRLRW
jgi:hypothetical protein